MSRLRTLLTLGRVSNLPTVWSNCLAGWWLGGRGNPSRLPLLLAGVSLLYLGGMFLNDAFDAEFDRQHRKERPIPSGAISLAAVWRRGFAWLLLGETGLCCAGIKTGVLGLVLITCILVYDATHKLLTISPILMGVCRFLVYLVAAATGSDGVTGWAIWCGLALAAYVTGLSFLARGESTRGPVAYWPLILLSVPIVLALLMNASDFREPALLLSTILGLWIVRCLRPAFWTKERNLRITVSGLLAGIVLLDMLAVADAPHSFSLIFLILFGAALFLQRAVRAT
jgi:4-hydroxybenzoate polyprenyltransferase